MIRRRLAVLTVSCVLAVVACSGDDNSASPRPSADGSAPATASAAASANPQVSLPPPPPGGFDPPVTVRFDGAPPIKAEVARTPAQRARGLMQRREVPEGTGMAFFFPGRTRSGFWMLGTLVPLSIAYVNGDRVISTAEMQPCETQQCPSYLPAGEYTVAVEAPANFFTRHGVKRGTRMRIEGTVQPAV